MAGLHIGRGAISDRGRLKEYEARAAGATEFDIRLSRQSGIDARDVMNLRRFTAAKLLLIVFRCPKTAARAFHGDLPAKTLVTKEKTNETGTIYNNRGVLMVSDYDMMSLWRASAGGFEKIYVSSIQSPGAARGRWLPEATALVREMNGFLITKIQHGCQDDFQNRAKNPGVKMADHFLAIRKGDGIYLPDPVHCENFYRAHRLFWPYGIGGKYIG
jgi:hypothetical protein